MRELEERKFQKIYENIATGIALTNLDGRIATPLIPSLPAILRTN